MVYKVCCYDREGRSGPPEIIEADDDREAIDLMTISQFKRCELWQDDRLVYSALAQELKA